MPTSSNLDSLDKAFILDVYETPEWTVRKIARKLDKTDSAVRAYARSKGLVRRFQRKPYAPSVDWEKIWTLHQNKGLRFYQIGEIVGCSYQAVGYAISKMNRMTPEEREHKWQLYRDAQKNTASGLELSSEAAKVLMAG